MSNKVHPVFQQAAMSCAEKERLSALCSRSKRGEHLSSEEISFLERCWRSWPIEYWLLNKEVFEATKPFGNR